MAWVTGETDVTVEGKNFAQCALLSEFGTPLVIHQQNLELDVPPNRGTYALTGATSLPNGGSIVLRCGTQPTSGLLPIDFVNNSLVVMQVDAIN